MTNVPTKKQLEAAIEIITNRLPFNADFCSELGMLHTEFSRDTWGHHAPSMPYQTRWAAETLYRAIIGGVQDA